MMKWVGRLGAFVTLGLSLSVVTPACDREVATTGDNSETHFLAKCEDSCGGGLECICGVCTKRCTEDAGCGELNADASCADSCGDASTKVCDVACTAARDCQALGADFGCYDGVCRTEPSEDGNGGQGGTGAPDGAGGADPSAAAGAGGSRTSPNGCQAAADPTPELKPSSELDADVLARAAAVLGSCWPDDGVERNAIHFWNQNTSALKWTMVSQIDCLANAQCGCAALSQCLGIEALTGVDPGCQPSCDNGVFTLCGAGADIEAGYAIEMDCNKLGLACDPVAGCSSGPATACSGTTGEVCRAGQRPLYCERDALREGADCEALGLGCADGYCQGTGAACTSDSLPVSAGYVYYEGASCTAGVLEGCVNGKRASASCADRGPGFDCQSVNGVAFCGLASECLPGDDSRPSSTHPARCDGNVVTFCNAGRLDSVDCTTLGFSGCNVDAQDGHYGCTPSLSL